MIPLDLWHITIELRRHRQLNNLRMRTPANSHTYSRTQTQRAQAPVIVICVFKGVVY